MKVQKLLNGLKELGFTDAGISRAVTKAGFSMSQPLITRLRNEDIKCTTYDKHKAIESLYKKALRQKNKEVK